MANEHDEAIEKVLAALKNAATPEGMEARIAQRLEHHTAAKAQSRWRSLFAGSTIASAWWRGALSGAGTAGLAIAVGLHLQHRLPATYAQIPPAATQPVPAAVMHGSTQPVRVVEVRTGPCIPTVQAVRISASSHGIETLRAESFQRSHPAPALALTAQERNLMRLARTADPKQLAAINTETHAKLDAEERADSLKFVAPPPPDPPEATDNTDSQPTVSHEGEEQ